MDIQPPDKEHNFCYGRVRQACIGPLMIGPPPPPDGGPISISATSGNERFTYQDVPGRPVAGGEGTVTYSEDRRRASAFAAQTDSRLIISPRQQCS